VLGSTRRNAGAALTIALALLVVAAAASGAPPLAGRYKVTHGFKFRFAVRQGICSAPPKNLTNYRAHAGPKKQGMCFASSDQPTIRVKCASGNSRDEMLIESFAGLRLVDGSLHSKTYTYQSIQRPTGYDELSLTISGGQASGFVRRSYQVPSGDLPGATSTDTCDSGKVPFTAVHQ
jgi:hypothetical protein